MRLSVVPLLSAALACAGCDPAGPEPVPVSGISIEDPRGVLIGDTVRLRATAYDSAGAPVDVAPTWTTRQPAIASVSADGLATGHAWGGAWLRVEAGAAADSVRLPVGARHAVLVLPTLGGDEAMGAAMVGGSVVGWSTVVAGEKLDAAPGGGTTEHAFRWRDDQIADLGSLGGAWSRAYGVNAAGHVVGVSDVGGSASRAFVHRDGAMADLGTLGGAHSAAHAIDDAGRIVGRADSVVSCTTGCALLSPTAPTLWLDGRPRALQPAPLAAGGVASEFGGTALAIAGEFIAGTHNWSAMRWTLDGAGAVLVGGVDSRGPSARRRESAGSAVTAAGVVLGWTREAGGCCQTWDAWLLAVDTPTLLEYDPYTDYTSSIGRGMNMLGHVVGDALEWNASEWHGMLWRDGTRHDLNVLAPSEYAITSAVAIEGDGRILANGRHRATGDRRVLLLTPEP